MARLLIVLFAIAVVVLVFWSIYQGFQWLLKRARQKELVRYAPELLQYHDVPGPVAGMVVEQQRQLNEAAGLMRRVLTDDAVLIPTEYADPMEDWLKAQPRRLTQ